MDHKIELEQTGNPIVLVRAVNTADLPEPMREKVGELDEVYAIMDEKGSYVALARDRDLAFDLAYQNELTPHSVH